MSKKLFVGNLSFQIEDQDLEEVFKEFGEVVSAKVIINKFNGRSKGFGFVEMASDDGAQSAIEGLDGKEVSGRPIRVSIAKEKSEYDKERTSSNNSF